jgi:hypothetical protein
MAKGKKEKEKKDLQKENIKIEREKTFVLISIFSLSASPSLNIFLL